MHLFSRPDLNRREVSFSVQTFWNFKIPAATVDETRWGQLELEEDIQRKAQVPTMHREMAGVLRKSSLIMPLLQLLPLMNPQGSSADFTLFRRSP